MLLYDSIGRIVSMTPHQGAKLDNLGSPRFSCKRLNLGDAVVVADPATHLTAAITDGGDGVGYSFPLAGTWLSSEITDDAPYFTVPLVDYFSRPVGGEQTLSVTLYVMARATVPTVADAVRFGAVVHNERDWRSATVDGRGVCASFTTTNPTSGAIQLVNGTTAISNSGSVAGILGAVSTVNRPGLTATNVAQWGGHICHGLDSNFDLVAASDSTRAQTNGTGCGATGQYYITVFACRTNVLDLDNYTVKFDVWHNAVVSNGRLS